MHIRLTRFRFDPGTVEQVLAIGRESEEALKTLPGYRGAQTGVDRIAGTCIAVSSWETDEQARFSRDELRQDERLGGIVRRLRDLGATFEPAEIYEQARLA
jgi:hypothetical protein